MNDNTVIDLSDLVIDSITVDPADAFSGLDEGHGMTELAASCHFPCFFSTAAFVADDDLL